MPQRWRAGEQVRIVLGIVQILVGFEGGDHHPVEWKGEEGHKENQNGGVGGLVGNAACAGEFGSHLTCPRCAWLTTGTRLRRRRGLGTGTERWPLLPPDHHPGCR